MEEDSTSLEDFDQSKDYTEDLDIINIISDPITAHILEKGIVKMSNKSTYISQKFDRTIQRNAYKSTKNNNIDRKGGQMNCNAAWSTQANVSDAVCLGSTFIIVILQLSVLVFYLFKDKRSDI